MPGARPRPAVLAAVVAAVFLIIALLAWRMVRHPPRWLGGESIAVEVDADHPYDEGVTPAQALERTVATIRRRAKSLSALTAVDVDGKRVRVVLPRFGTRIARDAATRILTGGGRLELKVVDENSPYMKGVVDSLQATPIGGVVVGKETWSDPVSGTMRRDVFVRAGTAESLRVAWGELVQRRGLPPDHAILPERRPRDWRSYYVFRKNELSGSVRDAQATNNAELGRPEIDVRFDDEAARQFETITGNAVGRKLAIVVDNAVLAAPVIASKISGGHARITLGGESENVPLPQQATELATLLRSGPLAAPVRLLEPH